MSKVTEVYIVMGTDERKRKGIRSLTDRLKNPSERSTSPWKTAAKYTGNTRFRMQPSNTTGLQQNIVVALREVVDLNLSIFIAFVAEFLIKAKEQMQYQTKEAGLSG